MFSCDGERTRSAPRKVTLGGLSTPPSPLPRICWSSAQDENAGRTPARRTREARRRIGWFTEQNLLHWVVGAAVSASQRRSKRPYDGASTNDAFGVKPGCAACWCRLGSIKHPFPPVDTLKGEARPL